MGAEPQYCYDRRDWHPVLSTICTEAVGNGDMAACLTKVALSTTSTGSGVPEPDAKGVYRMRDISAELCRQLPKDKCRSYGTGEGEIRCQWHEHGDEKTGGGSCGEAFKRYGSSEVDSWRAGSLANDDVFVLPEPKGAEIETF